MKNHIDIDKLTQGDRRTLAKAITMVESKRPQDQKLTNELVEKILPYTGKSKRIGISGVPGVGKSTFIESLGIHLITELNTNIAVLAVDPSSPVSGGSILGDKTRMEKLSQQEEAFIRPSPSQGHLGGVTQKTRETMLLCEAAGFQNILIETVGVGQSEFEVNDLVDFFLVLMLPNAGDELQGIKKGILELAQAIVINKADGDFQKSAQFTAQQYQNAFHLVTTNSSWQPQVITCSALQGTNIPQVWQLIEKYYGITNSKELSQKRAKQNALWMERLLLSLLQKKLKDASERQSEWQKQYNLVIEGKTTPFTAAQKLIALIK